MSMTALVSSTASSFARKVKYLRNVTCRSSSSSTSSTFWPRKLPETKAPSDVDGSNPASGRMSTGMPSTPLDPKHAQPLGSWSQEQINEAVKDHVMLTWTPSKVRHHIPIITKAEGVYMYDIHGKKYLDWTSQAVCTNLGHTVPTSISDAIQDQLQSVPFAYGGMAMAEIRARLASLVTDLLPGDLTGCTFPSSGSEANEAAISVARRYTGKFKVINWYRSYHGGTQNSKAATGDFRRWMGGDMVPGFVKAWSPYPLFWDFAGDTETERTKMALSMLEEQILNEGPETIALIQFESIIGSGGVVIPPPGYMEGVRDLCDKYEILLHCDEVMAGFGRTGKLFGFQHFDGVVPDIVTCAKGLTASYLPLSMMACRQHVFESFEEKSIGWGSTYQGHPVSMACAYETLKFMIKEDVMGNVKKLEPVMAERMHSIAEKHPCIKQYRHIGLFGCFDVQDKNGENPQLQHEAPQEPAVAYKKAYTDNGLMGLIRYPHLHVAPPLIISETELLDGFDRQDKALSVLDSALGFH
mmetsp:Transcript_27684/g.66686  ORF Transcript_27684/g.66686 Transcript_27684/m.66686 type:complete len:526 (+) Transcript_27684:124-1701(+)